MIQQTTAGDEMGHGEEETADGDRSGSSMTRAESRGLAAGRDDRDGLAYVQKIRGSCSTGTEMRQLPVTAL